MKQAIPRTAFQLERERIDNIGSHLSWLCRHSTGVTRDAAGWIEVAPVLRTDRRLRNLACSRKDLKEAIWRDTKGRFEYDAGRDAIRATSSWSAKEVRSEKAMQKIEDWSTVPKLLYHGTKMVHIPNIMVEGLRPANAETSEGRLHVHLTPFLSGQQGPRKGSDALVTVASSDLREALQTSDGALFKTVQGWYLTESKIPPEILSVETWPERTPVWTAGSKAGVASPESGSFSLFLPQGASSSRPVPVKPPGMPSFFSSGRKLSLEEGERRAKERKAKLEAEKAKASQRSRSSKEPQKTEAEIVEIIEVEEEKQDALALGKVLAEEAVKEAEKAAAEEKLPGVLYTVDIEDDVQEAELEVSAVEPAAEAPAEEKSEIEKVLTAERRPVPELRKRRSESAPVYRSGEEPPWRAGWKPLSSGSGATSSGRQRPPEPMGPPPKRQKKEQVKEKVEVEEEEERDDPWRFLATRAEDLPVEEEKEEVAETRGPLRLVSVSRLPERVPAPTVPAKMEDVVEEEGNTLKKQVKEVAEALADFLLRDTDNAALSKVLFRRTREMLTTDLSWVLEPGKLGTLSQAVLESRVPFKEGGNEALDPYELPYENRKRMEQILEGVARHLVFAQKVDEALSRFNTERRRVLKEAVFGWTSELAEYSEGRLDKDVDAINTTVAGGGSPILTVFQAVKLEMARVKERKNR